MHPRGSCPLCYSQRKRGNLGIKAAELRHSLALRGGEEHPWGRSRGGGEEPAASRLQSPFSEHTGLQGWFGDGAGVGGAGSGGLLEQMVGRGFLAGQGPAGRRGAAERGELCSWLVPQPAATGRGRVTEAPGTLVTSG